MYCAGSKYFVTYTCYDSYFFEGGAFDKVFLCYKHFFGRVQLYCMFPTYLLWRSLSSRASTASRLSFLDHRHLERQTQQDSPNERSARRRGRLLHNTQQTQQMNILALSGFPTLNSGNRDRAATVLSPDTRLTIADTLKLCPSLRMTGEALNLQFRTVTSTGRDSAGGIATRYGLDGPGIESRWGRDFPYPYIPALGPTQPPVQWIPCLSRG